MSDLRDDLINSVWEGFRVVYGHKPRHLDFDTFSNQELEEFSEQLWNEAEENEARALNAFESEIQCFISNGAKSRRQAVDWMIQNLDEYDYEQVEIYGAGYLSYIYDVPSSIFIELGFKHWAS